MGILKKITKLLIGKIKKTDFYIYMVLALIPADFGLMYLYFKLSENKNKPKPYFILASIIAITFIILFLVWVHKENKRINDIYTKYEEYLRKKLGETKSNTNEAKEESQDVKNENKDVINDMIKNNAEIIEYFRITKQQERISYVISIGCAIVGVIMFAVSVFGGAEGESTIITVVSGSVTEVVSGIVLWIHNKSAMQLNYYYDALHENEKFLSAISLADKLEKPQKDQMYMEIIKAQIRAREENKEDEK